MKNKNSSKRHAESSSVIDDICEIFILCIIFCLVFKACAPLDARTRSAASSSSSITNLIIVRPEGGHAE